jgi:phenylacetate-coenzyme A ligase PaaK-like adenylate-forming protein
VFERLLNQPPYSLRQSAKEPLLLEGLNELTRHHYEKSPEYKRIIDAAWGGLKTYGAIAEVPYLPVSLFKEMELKSTALPAMVMRSSGTTGQRTSRIIIDNETARRQSEALVASFLAVDTKDVIKPTDLTARGGGVLGMMKFGAKTAFALDSQLDLDKELVENFVQANGAEPFLIFGFTFLVWDKLYRAFADGGVDLSNAILIHSGGWKKLEAQKVSNAEFRAALKRRFNMANIYNFYGFVEQIGSVFIEGPDGLLYPPNFTDIIIRRPHSWEPADIGDEGVIQVVSLLPRSYPGHSVLTEDMGVVETIDAGAGNRFGKAIRVVGRAPKTELRGCSDVIAA